MSELQCKSGIYKQWKLGQASKEKFRNIALVYRDDIQRFNARLEMTLAMEVKARKKSSFEYFSSEKLDK